eukprot:2998193-Rhodomonas_salina.2
MKEYGVGLGLRVQADYDTGQEVRWVIPESPAEKAGIREFTSRSLSTNLATCYLRSMGKTASLRMSFSGRKGRQCR